MRTLRDLYLQNMARSAIADLRDANQDIASLEELAKVIYDISLEEAGGRTSYFPFSHDKSSIDLSRAYNYINVCLETSRIYNNLVRTVSIARVMDDILAAYQQRDREQRQRQAWATVAMAVLLLVLAVGVVVVWRQKRRLSQSRLQLQQANEALSVQRSALTQANADLTEVNRKLQEAME